MPLLVLEKTIIYLQVQIFLIDKIKAGDAYTEYFSTSDGEREGEPEGFVNEVDITIGKTVKCFTLNQSGLGWFPVFDS